MHAFINRLAIFFLSAVIMAQSIAADAKQLPFFSVYPAFDKVHWRASDGWSNGEHQSCEWKAANLTPLKGNLQLRLSDKGATLRPYSCAELQSTGLSRYGRYEARMRAAAGKGLNTAFFTYVGPPVGVPAHDEIDFEFLGKDTHNVEITYWQNGEKHDPVDIPLRYDASAEFHNYAFEWSPTSIRWYIDNHLVHETPVGATMPDNPSRIYLSLWSGSAVEDSWMGHFTYQKPVTAEVAWVKFASAKEGS